MLSFNIHHHKHGFKAANPTQIRRGRGSAAQDDRRHSLEYDAAIAGPDERSRMTLLGRGGMGSVYLLVDTSWRRWALKLLRRELVASQEHVERFTREAAAARRCAHPNVVEVIDTGFLADGRAYILMEYLTGEDLAATLRREIRLPWARARHIALQICDALAAAHDRGIIHRDLKPGNCFRITRAGDPDFIKVLDFGVAKLLDRSYETLTRPGELVGTPRYMAPEQIEGRPIDFSADVYALGAMLYHMLTGQTAATGSSNLEIIYSVMMRSPEPFAVVAPDLVLPGGMWPVVVRAMARDPAKRFASMQEFAAALAAIDSPPVHAPRAPHEPHEPPMRPSLQAPVATRDAPPASPAPPAPFMRPELRPLVAARDVPDLRRHLVTLAAPAAAPGPRGARPPTRALEERLPQVLASLVIVFSICVLWVSGLEAGPSPTLAVAKALPRVRKPPVQLPSPTPVETLSSQPVPDGQLDDTVTPVTPVNPSDTRSGNSATIRATMAKNPTRSPRTAQGVVTAHRKRYSKCQQEELRADPSAPRRYTLAITIDPDGQAERVEVLTVASPTMKFCIETVTRTLTLPAPRAGAEHAIVSLSFPGAPRR